MSGVTPPENLESVKHLWDVWQYRHGFFWGAVVRWGLAVVAVSVIPHLKPEFALIKGWVFIFPATAALLTIFSFFHLLAEHQRLLAATEKYMEYSAGLFPDIPHILPTPNNPATRPYSFVTGPVVIVVYLIALLLLCFINAIYLATTLK